MQPTQDNIYAQLNSNMAWLPEHTLVVYEIDGTELGRCYMKQQQEVFVSVDVETDGPIPSDYSMLSLGAAALTPSGTLISSFHANLQLLDGARSDPDTMAWWAQNQAAYDATRQNTQPPKQAMERFVKWVNGLSGKPVFVGYPAGFDFLFVYWYIRHFGLESPFSFSALDIKTYACAMLRLPYRESTKRNMPKRWFPKDPHTHIAVEDAIEQGKLFCAMWNENNQKGQ